jgi:hypothetical protein
MRGDAYTKYLRLKIKDANRAMMANAKESLTGQDAIAGCSDSYDAMQRFNGQRLAYMVALSAYLAMKGWDK